MYVSWLRTSEFWHVIYRSDLKDKNTVHCKSKYVDDFRGISISPTISKVFEHCILDRHCEFVVTSDNQFGFKKRSSCAHAIFSLRSVVDYYVKCGSTINICALDLTKAFDKMKHHGLFIKLVENVYQLCFCS